MTLTSRHFGPIDPSALDDASTSTTITIGDGSTITVRLFIADPPQFRQDHVDQTDAAIDYFGQLDERARALIVVAALDHESVPGRVFSSSISLDDGQDLTPEEFTRELRLGAVTISPDGGTESLDRVSITYVSKTTFSEQAFAAIVREGVGIVFAAVDEVEPRESSIFYR